MTVCHCVGRLSPEQYELMVQIYQRYDRAMYGVAARYIVDHSRREDVLQDVLVKLMEKAELLGSLEQRALTAYIMTAVRNTAKNALRTQRWERLHLSELDGNLPELPARSGALPEEMLLLEEYRSAARGVWRELSPKERALLREYYLAGRTSREMAQRLHCTPENIRMGLTRARRRARGCLLRRMGCE